ncbi:LTA synthase family protein [Algirhabdus cladophorae]|uniref:LTA synthase family protein n=1 Tax=Algirhabdus cladophorae TaxID=3377108 RepID=UPI003B84B529
MATFGRFFIYLSLYGSGIALYSNLFIFSANHSFLSQMAKVFVASVHCLIFVLPVLMAQSRNIVVRLLGWIILLVYFGYVFFLTSYFAYFGMVPELYAFGTSNATDVTEVAAHYFAQIFGINEIACIVLAIIFFICVPKYKLGREAWLVVALPVLLLSASFYRYGEPFRSKDFGNVTVVRRFGIPTFSYLSMYEWMTSQSGYLADNTVYPGRVSELIHDTQPGTTALATLPDTIKKVILIQIESFDPEAVDAVLNGVPAMPFVADLQNKCLNFDNFFTTKSVGGSSDAEFSLATGLIPSAKRPSIRHADFERVPTLYERLKAQGIDSYFAHNNHIGFYGRQAAYGQMPNITYRFQGPKENISEADFASKTLANALATSDRFFYYFFNFKSHGPYLGYSEETAAAFALDTRTDNLQNYLVTMNEVDQLISSMFQQQLDGFEAGETVFMVTADHPSYLHTVPTLESLTRIPMMLCHNSLTGETVDKLTSTIDLHPTILDLFGLPASETEIAQNMLSDTDNAVLLPVGKILFRDPDGTVQERSCNQSCRTFFDYTDQHIKLGQ